MENTLAKIAPPDLSGMNDEQAQAFHALVTFILRNEYENAVPEVLADSTKLMLLGGFAGTGKTYTINRVVEFCKEVDADLVFGMTAPTNRAVKVLQQQSRIATQLTFGTIHSLLGLKEKIDERTGQRTFEQAYTGHEGPGIEKLTVLIVDESSMLNEELFNLLTPYSIRKRPLRIIFMGDPLQIPPVHEKLAYPFKPDKQREYGIRSYVLVKPMRQKEGNPILEYTHAIREQITFPYIDFKLEGNEKEEHGIFVVPRDLDEIKKIVDVYFRDPEWVKDTDRFKLLCWRNVSVDYFNKLVREVLFGANVDQYIVGDQLVADKPIFLRNPVGLMEIAFTTSDELVVEEAVTTTNNYRYEAPVAYHNVTFRVWKLKVCLRNTNYRTYLYTLHADSVSEYDKVLKELRGYAMRASDKKERSKYWKQFYSFQNNFAALIYNYCLTVHKSQGGSYNNCLVMEWDIDMNRNVQERNSIRYVAASRARNKLYISK